MALNALVLLSFLSSLYFLRARLSQTTRLCLLRVFLQVFSAFESFCARVNGFGLGDADVTGVVGGGCGVASGNV